MFPNEVSIKRRGRRWRSLMWLGNGLMVSVLIAHSVHPWKQTVKWQIDPVRHECGLLTLLARLDEEKRSFLDFYIIPNMDCLKRFNVSLVDPWLNRGRGWSNALARNVPQARLGVRLLQLQSQKDSPAR